MKRELVARTPCVYCGSVRFDVGSDEILCAGCGAQRFLPTEPFLRRCAHCGSDTARVAFDDRSLKHTEIECGSCPVYVCGATVDEAMAMWNRRCLPPDRVLGNEWVSTVDLPEEAARMRKEQDLLVIHELKTWPGPFEAIVNGIKRFEFRRDDRGFAVGDVLALMYWDPTPARSLSHVGYRAHRWTAVRVDYLIRGFGIPDGFVCMSVSPLAVPPCDTPVCMRHEGHARMSGSGWVSAKGGE